MQNVIVIGMGLSCGDLTAAQLEIIRSADVLMGGRRHLDQFQDLQVDKQVITASLAETMACLRARKADQRIVVLASGDPLFFGIGARIVSDLGRDQVTIYPNISSIAAAFSRINEPWGDAKIVSLHGRDRKWHLLAALRTHATVAVLTDLKQTPGWLAGWLLAKGAGHWQMAVCEQLGTPAEKFDWYALERAAGKTFAQPNVVILKRSAQVRAPASGLHLGMADDAFRHESGLITKSEVRAVTLAKLCLKPGLTLWDLGAGSGSVGIEAAALLGAGRVVAVEHKSGRVAQIRENAGRFGVYNHEVIQSRLPEGLEALPPPDRIFIGGGGRDLAAIIRQAADRLAPGGVLVVNSVLMDNLTTAVAALETKGLNPEVVQLQISRSRAMPWSMRMEARNPVWIITGCHGAREER